jgi:hypothetical protein
LTFGEEIVYYWCKYFASDHTYLVTTLFKATPETGGVRRIRELLRDVSKSEFSLIGGVPVMNHRKSSLRFALLMLLVICNGVSANGDGRKPRTAPSNDGKFPSAPNRLQKPSGTPFSTLVNVNNLSMWISADGLSARDPATGNSGTIFPRGTAGVVFQDGMVWGGLVNDGLTPRLRVGGQTYSIGTSAGRIISPGVAENPSAPDVRIWRIRRDYVTADLRQDAAELLRVPPGAVSEADVAAVRAHYETDWNEWPVAKGAPFYDVNGNGIYEPGFSQDLNGNGRLEIGEIEEPGLGGADQVVWFVANDLDVSATTGLYGSPPIGLEMQGTLWAYDRPGALSNMIFKRTRLIYKGTASTPVNARIDSMFIAQWSDPDVGELRDDFAGCDTVLSLGFAYNATIKDNQYAQFGLRPPAIGYDLLQGPIVPDPNSTAIFDFKYRPGFKNLPMTTFTYFGGGGPDALPSPGVYDGTLQWYNLMRACRPRPEYPNCTPFTNHLGQVTQFQLSGDPVTRSGDLDGVVVSPGERQIVMVSGPFTIARGDTQEVVVALVGGSGNDNLDSITKMKANDRVAQSLYDNFLQLTALPPELALATEFFSQQSTNIRVVADARGLNTSVITATLKEYDNNLSVATFSLLDDGGHNDGSPGDQVYGNTISVTPRNNGLFLNLDVAYNDGSQVTWEHLADDVTTAGPVEVSAFAVVSDNFNDDGNVNPGENIRYVLTVWNQSAFNFTNVAVTAQPDPEGKRIELGFLSRFTAVSLNYNTGDPLSYFTFDVPADYQAASFDIAISVTDLSHNRWLETLEFAVKPFPGPIYGTPLAHTAGLSDWNFNVLVVDPNAVRDRAYEITIADSIDAARHRGFTLTNLVSGNILLLNHALPDSFGHNIPVTDGFKVLRGENFGILGLRQDLTRWISSNPAWFRGFRFIDDPHAAFNGGVTTGFQLDQYLAHMNSSFDPTVSVQVEVRFDPTQPQKAYRLRRTGTGAAYLIQDTDPFVDVPFSVWDVNNPSLPRQLTVAWRDQDNSGTWNPPVGTDDGLEIVFIYFKSYDPTGTTQFSMPPTAIPDEPTIGSKADIMYGLSLEVRTGHTLNESTGTLFLHAYVGLSSRDRFTFNPAVVSVQDMEIIPVKFSLAQNFPNPFNPATIIRFSIPRRERVRLKVYNLTGQEIVTLVDKELEAGPHQVEWRGLNKFHQSTATGVYFYRLEAGDFVEVKKMVLLR